MILGLKYKLIAVLAPVFVHGVWASGGRYWSSVKYGVNWNV